MTTPLRAWLQDRLEPSHPISPRRRAREPPDPRKAVATSPFYRLPPELRWRILDLAFGGARIMHMDLLPPKRWMPKNGRSEQPLHIFEPYHLRWWGYVCVRTKRDDPCLDWCRSRYWRQRDEDGFPGVMGWLLSCRLGYLEAVDVLYSRNTFHIGSIDLIKNIDVVLPVSHLARITSLELICHLAILRGSNAVGIDGQRRQDWDVFEDILSKTADSFPSLRSLYLSIEHGEKGYDRSLLSPSQGTMESLETALAAVDRIIQDRQRPILIEVAVPRSIYYAAEKEAERNGIVSERIHNRWDRQFRRHRDKTKEYWVRCGMDDSTAGSSEL